MRGPDIIKRTTVFLPNLKINQAGSCSKVDKVICATYIKGYINKFCLIKVQGAWSIKELVYYPPYSKPSILMKIVRELGLSLIHI